MEFTLLLIHETLIDRQGAMRTLRLLFESNYSAFLQLLLSRE
jgi:hypothetical protein